jgi:hypothetical protein
LAVKNILLHTDFNVLAIHSTTTRILHTAEYGKIDVSGHPSGLIIDNVIAAVGDDTHSSLLKHCSLVSPRSFALVASSYSPELLSEVKLARVFINSSFNLKVLSICPLSEPLL